MHKTRDHKGTLSSLALSTALNKAATCGMGGIKIHELADQYVIDSIISIDEGNDNLSEIGSSLPPFYSFIAHHHLIRLEYGWTIISCC